MDLKRILIPIDFSDGTAAVNEYASTLAAATGAEMIYLHAIVPDIPYADYATIDTQVDDERIQSALESVAPTEEGVPCRHVIRHAMPSEAILEYADEATVDLIVMGTHGRKGIRRVLMGSVAELVVRKSECPVLAIKAATLAEHPS